MNNKGGSKIIAMYWFVILMIVAGGIFVMVSSFYNHPYDIREIEGEIMINNIANCLSYEGKLNSELFDEEGFSQEFSENFLENCHLNFEVEESLNEEVQYYFEIDFYKSENLEISTFNIFKGNLNLVAGYEIQEEKEYEREVKGVEDSFFSLDEKGEELYLIKILTIIKKTEKNVK
ncbi:hypothetical protein KAI04_01730 [Candidatus Pacearchaeota archaeon]|nr:hypothetical protein [Candidatus Pacearchaeota archaeon]